MQFKYVSNTLHQYNSWTEDTNFSLLLQLINQTVQHTSRRKL